ncbi:hypothetical protein SRHO_G00104450 [Serrasalmus rhombeus]
MDLQLSPIKAVVDGASADAAVLQIDLAVERDACGSEPAKNSHHTLRASHSVTALRPKARECRASKKTSGASPEEHLLQLRRKFVWIPTRQFFSPSISELPSPGPLGLRSRKGVSVQPPVILLMSLLHHPMQT